MLVVPLPTHLLLRCIVGLGRTRGMSTRSYKDAIEHLNTLQSNAATLDALRASGIRKPEFTVPEMVEYLGRIGYSPQDLNQLNVIHIAGTKGKGSAAAFTESILRHCKPHWKIGLYTSPHLVAVRERIRINGVPLSEEDFAKFFFEVWDRLEHNDTRQNSSTSPKPMYFRFITLMAYHAFLSLKVDATVLEVGLGGAYDCTNVVPKPIVTAVTSLGLDHVHVLGNTINQIAWQKGGIFKEGVAAFTVDQPEDGLEVLEQRASELKASEFTVIQPVPGLSDVKLGIAGSHQFRNASLAVHLARAFLRIEGPLLSEAFVKGLQNTRWPGRCQQVPDHASSRITWYLDGAHTDESVQCCMNWFCHPDVGLRPLHCVTRVLIFNCTSGRSGSSFLSSMLATVSSQLKLYQQTAHPGFFDHVIFCPNVTYANGKFKGEDLVKVDMRPEELASLTPQHRLASAWSSLVPEFPPSGIHVVPSIQHAVDLARQLDDKTDVDVLVTGSLHLVGGLIEVAGLTDLVL